MKLYKENYIMSFEPIAKFNLKPIKPVRFARPEHTAEFITIRKNDLYLSNKLYERLELPDFVIIAVDYDKRAIGVKATDKTDAYGYKITMLENGGARLRAATAAISTIAGMIDGCDLSKVNLRLLRGKAQDGYFVFDLAHRETITKRHFRKDDK